MKKPSRLLANPQFYRTKKFSFRCYVFFAGNQGNGELVKVSFLSGIRCGRVGILESTWDGVLRVASLEDLMATKTLLQRVSAKDYTDIAAMVKGGIPSKRTCCRP